LKVKFQVRAKGSYDDAIDFKEMMVSKWKILPEAKSGPRVVVARDTPNSILYHAIANEISGKKIRQGKDDLKEYWKGHSNATLWITPHNQDHCFNFAYAPFDRLDDFLGKPSGWVFLRLEILIDGCRNCLQNALDLATSVESSIKQGNIPNHHIEFFLLTALEEFGKALLLLKQGKETKKTGKKATDISWFRSHYQKFSEMSRQLFVEKIRIDNAYRRVFERIIALMQASGYPRASEFSEDIIDNLFRLSSPEELWEDSLSRGLRHPAEHYREQIAYVEYIGTSEEFLPPQTQWSKSLLVAVAELLKISCKIMIREINAKKEIDKIRDIKEVITSPDFVLPSDF